MDDFFLNQKEPIPFFVFHGPNSDVYFRNEDSMIGYFRYFATFSEEDIKIIRSGVEEMGDLDTFSFFESEGEGIRISKALLL